MNPVFLVFGRVQKTFIFGNKNKIVSPKGRLVMESSASQHYKFPYREHMCHGRHKLLTFPNFRDFPPSYLPNLISYRCIKTHKEIYIKVGR